MTNVIFYGRRRFRLENRELIVYDVLMRDLIGKLMILCYCLFSLLFLPIRAEFVAGLFFVVSISCLISVFSTSRYVMVIPFIYLLLSIAFPVLCAFYPVLFYDFARKRNWLISLLYLCSLMYQMLPTHWTEFFFLLLGSAISAFLSYQIKSWMTLESSLIRTRDDSKEMNLLLSEKNRHLIESQNQEIYTATLQERNRIAREIHDNVGHMLSRSILMVGALRTINKQDNLSPSLLLLEDTLNQAMNNVRESVHDLHDDSVDLRASVEEIISNFTKCTCRLDYDMGRFIPNEIKYSLIAIIQEALTNVIRHSDATLVHVRLREHPGLYQLVIDDNGSTACSAADAASNYPVGGGMGLSNMRDRIHALHGNIQFQTDQGFHIFITIPKGENK